MVKRVGNSKKGISPLIATVLIIGFTVAVGLIVFFWIGGFKDELTQGAEITETVAKNCGLASIKIKQVEQTLPGQLTFLLQNTGLPDIDGLTFYIIGTQGSVTIQKQGLKSSAKQIIHVQYDDLQVGPVKEVEVKPTLLIDKQPKTCDGVDKKIKQSQETLEMWEAACGDGNKDPWEECADYGENDIQLPSYLDISPDSCKTLGYESGNLGCNKWCGVDITQCVLGTGEITCGNKQLDTIDFVDEECDIGSTFELLTNPPDMTCQDLGRTYGQIYCNRFCHFDLSGCSSPEGCGDNTQEEPEICDGTDLAGKTCTDFEYTGGDLACSISCTGYNAQACIGDTIVDCDNNVLDNGEVCETNNLNGETCQTKGYEQGTLTCTTCTGYNTQGCNNAGNGAIDPPYDTCESDEDSLTCTPVTEVCDGSNLDGETCVSQGYDSGDLACSSDGLTFDTSGCIGEPICGNAIAEALEVCDGTDLKGETCVSQGFAGGNLACSSTCDYYFTSNCYNLPQIQSGLEHTCLISDTGEMYCWGKNLYGQLGITTDNLPRLIPAAVDDTLLGTVKSMALGYYHTCAIKTSGEVYCWGHETYGEVGDDDMGAGNHKYSPTPVVNLRLDAAKSISAKLYHTCAIRASDDKAFCWGSNIVSQLGTTEGWANGPRPYPVAVLDTELGAVKAISAGNQHTCAIRASDDKAFCWGRNIQGQLGDGNSGSWGPGFPTEVIDDLLGHVKAISAGEFHTCAIRASDDKPFCWGDNGWGQLGDGERNIDKNVPTEVKILSSVKAISAGESHNCAVNSEGKSFCWGSAGYGELGDDDPVYAKDLPVEVLGTLLGTTASISAGEDYTCAVNSEGKVFCWGRNNEGQLGDGNSGTTENVPKEVIY